MIEATGSFRTKNKKGNKRRFSYNVAFPPKDISLAMMALSCAEAARDRLPKKRRRQIKIRIRPLPNKGVVLFQIVTKPGAENFASNLGKAIDESILLAMRDAIN